MAGWSRTSIAGIRGVELRVADAVTGEERGTAAAPGLSTRFDALSFLYSAGSWSPDGQRLAFVSYADGDNEIDIVNVENRDIERRIKPKGIGAISTVAWSPDGNRLAFSGMVGGVSDLYLFELSSGMTRRLTNDLHADLQPAWSPDGKSIAFVSDREGPLPEGTEAGSDFRRLSHAPLRVAVVDATTGPRAGAAGDRRAPSTSARSSAPTGSPSTSSPTAAASATSTASRSRPGSCTR